MAQTISRCRIFGGHAIGHIAQRHGHVRRRVRWLLTGSPRIPRTCGRYSFGLLSGLQSGPYRQEILAHFYCWSKTTVSHEFFNSNILLSPTLNLYVQDKQGYRHFDLSFGFIKQPPSQEISLIQSLTLNTI